MCTYKICSVEKYEKYLYVLVETVSCLKLCINIALIVSRKKY